MTTNDRTATKAAIKRATKQAQTRMRSMDAEALAALESIYRRAADQIRADIDAVAGGDTVRLSSLQALLRQVRARLGDLKAGRDELLTNSLGEAANVGAGVWAAAGAEIATPLGQVAGDAVNFVRNLVAEDGLQLSDRIWRLDRHADRVVTEAIEQAVIQGDSASRAAQDLLGRGQAVPADIASKMDMAQGSRVQKLAGDALMTGKGAPYDNARRLFRTEINRAHGEAYKAAAFEHPEVIGTRFLLSPNHPKPDVCDMHASVDRYGLGPGVYPKGKSPWPAHPNTMSFEEAVFSDEVESANATDRIAWLKDQPADVQESVLGKGKAQLLRDGTLSENEINTPWKVLKKRYAIDD